MRPYGDFYFNTPGVGLRDYLEGIGTGLSEDEVLKMLPEKKRREVLDTGMITCLGNAIFSVFILKFQERWVKDLEIDLKTIF